MVEHADESPKAGGSEPEVEAPEAAESGQAASAGPDAAALREAIERLVAVGIGAVGATADKAEALLGTTRSGQRITDRASVAIAALLDDLGLVKRERFAELELKVAQLEHRVRLLEESGRSRPGGEPGSPGKG